MPRKPATDSDKTVMEKKPAQDMSNPRSAENHGRKPLRQKPEGIPAPKILRYPLRPPKVG